MAAVRHDAATHAAPEAAAPVHSRLTQLEWSVVAIGRKDSRSSLRKPGWFSVLGRVLFSNTNPRLADPRLEALRRLAVLSWHDGPALPLHEIRALLDAGFTLEQYDAIKEHIHAFSERDRGTVALL
jgi:hypothetical protein